MADTKITNVIGVPIPQWLVEQFRVRAEKGTTGAPRDTRELLFYGNKTAWVRLVSSVNADPTQLKYLKGSLNITDNTSLAKQFMLFAGTSKYVKPEGGNEYSQQLRSGLGEDGSYGILGKEEIAAYGYTPMPGITSVNIETMGRMGSVRAATINFRVFNKYQLDVIDALYFKLGYTMLLEWGHTYYYKSIPNVNDEALKLYSTEELMIDPFQEGYDKEKVHYEIAMNNKKSYGNYDGMLGVTTNFNFSRKEDGSYDCSVKMIALGSFGESLKLNRSEVFMGILTGEIKKLISTENEELRRKRAQEIAQVDANLTALTESQKPKKITFEDYFKSLIKPPDTVDKYRYYSSAGEEDIYYTGNPQVWGLKKFGVLLDPSDNIAEVKTKKWDTFFNDLYGFEKNPKANIANREPKLIPYKVDPTNKSIDRSERANDGLVDEDDDDWISMVTKDDTETWIPIKFYRDVTVKGKRKIYYYVLIIKNAGFNFFMTGGGIVKSNNVGGIEYSYDYRHLKSASNIALKHALGFYSNTDPQSNEVKGIDNIKIYFRIRNTVAVPAEPYLIVKNKVLPKEMDAYDGLGLIENGRNYGKLTTIPTIKDGLEYYFVTNDSTFLEGIKLESTSISADQLSIQEFTQLSEQEKQQLQGATAAATQLANQNKQNINEKYKAIDVAAAQGDEAGKFNTSIEAALRLIQVYSLNRSTQNNNNVRVINFLEEGRALAKALFGEAGLYSPYYDQLVGDKSFRDIPDYGSLSSIKNIDKKLILEFYIKYGFNHNLLSCAHSENPFTSGNKVDALKYIKGKEVDHKELLLSYVLPYKVNQEFSQGVVLDRPVYIKFGTLLMLINHLALMYESKKEKSQDKSPIFYVDYNTKTNFCLTSLNHLTTNPFNFFIPYSGDAEQFKKLFDKSLLPTVGAPFNNAKDDLISGEVRKTAPFMEANAINEGVYQGKIMNVLIDIDYLLNTFKRFSTQDGTNSVYFKPFMESIISDMNKALGNYNLLRLAYNDPGNCYFVTDDQLVPPSEKEDKAYRTRPQLTNRTELPLHGKTSVAKNLEIKTEISSKLANLIAISANSPNNQAAMGSDATSFGFFNTHFRDRYIADRGETVVQQPSQATGSGKPTEGDKQSAKKFNDAVKNFYKGGDVQVDYVNGATNYYMSRMNKIKAETPATRASAVIPVSVNFTTDGISGLHMYQAFTVNEELLPYTYEVKFSEEQSVIRKVGFVVVGLSHTIESNVWNTSVKANMIYLRDTVDYNEKASQTVYTPSPPTQPQQGSAPSLANNRGFKLVPGAPWEEITFAFITAREGFKEVPYWDYNALRAGYGTDKILINGKLETVVQDTRFTEEIAKATLIKEIQVDYSKRVIRRIGKDRWEQLNDRQKAALTSYAYNVGFGEKSPFANNIVNAINSNAPPETVAEFMREGPITAKDKRTGKVVILKGLIERRKLEANLYLS